MPRSIVQMLGFILQPNLQIWELEGLNIGFSDTLSSRQRVTVLDLRLGEGVFIINLE
jgi:hypothetical protein